MKDKVLKSGIWFTVSNFLMKATGFITTPIFTRLMTKTEYGDFSTFQTWMMIMLYITSLNLEGSLIRACHDFKDDIDRYLFSMISLSMVSTVIWWCVVNIFCDRLGDVLGFDRLYLNCMFMYLFFCPAINLFQNAERFKYNYKWTVATSLSISVGASLLSVFFVITMQNRFMGRVIGYIIPTVIIGLMIVLYYIKKGKKIDFKYWKYALKISIPYIPHLLSMYLLSNMDRIMIKDLCGSEYVALYSLAYTCGMLITIFVTSINNAYSPWLADMLNASKYKSIKKVSVPYVTVFSFLAIGAVLVTPEILFVLGGESYMEAKYVMPPVAAGCLIQFVYCMYVNIEQYEKKTVGMAFASMMAAGLNFVLNYICILKFGYVAAAYTTYASYLFLLFMHMYFVKKIGMTHVYDNKKILTVSIGASILIFSTNVLLKTTLIRYLIIVIYIGIAIVLLLKHKNLILKFIRK